MILKGARQQLKRVCSYKLRPKFLHLLFVIKVVTVTLPGILYLEWDGSHPWDPNLSFWRHLNAWALFRHSGTILVCLISYISLNAFCNPKEKKLLLWFLFYRKKKDDSEWFCSLKTESCCWCAGTVLLTVPPVHSGILGRRLVFSNSFLFSLGKKFIWRNFSEIRNTKIKLKFISCVLCLKSGMT